MLVTVLAGNTGRARVRNAGDFAVLAEATVRIEADELTYSVELTIDNATGVATCRRLTLEQKAGGPPVTGEHLRALRLVQLVQTAAEAIAFRRSPDGGLEPLDEDELHELLTVRTAERRSTRRRITDADLRELADVVRLARSQGRSYIALAELRMGITHDQARQWKRKAIDAGLLEEETR